MARLTVCLELFFTDLPLAERLGRVKDAGFDAGEFWGWRDKDLEAIARSAQRHQVAITSLTAMSIHPGLTDATKHEEFVAAVRESAEAAKRVHCPNLIVMAGNVLPSVPRSRQLANIVEGLQKLAPVAEKAAVTLVLELLNSRYDHPGYFLDNSEEMGLIIRAVNHPNVKALYDIYHAGIMEGNIIENIRANIGTIGHFHAAGIPGRNEPWLGEQNYPAICRAIDELGFTGYIGLEYRPTKDHRRSLVETREWFLGS
jgi:hydroxypyruvate isomerase